MLFFPFLSTQARMHARMETQVHKHFKLTVGVRHAVLVLIQWLYVKSLRLTVEWCKIDM